jgi:ATP-dependent DNA helicase RecQ
VDAKEILEKYWGYSSFRPLQEQIVLDSINGFDCLALLPTGGGKSICFQVPGIIREGITIVISPLIALMQDQVNNLKKFGLRATAITSAMTYREIDVALDNAVFQGIDFLYISPERLHTTLFIERLKKMKVGLLVVDEAHCISEWGHDFRPSYAQIGLFRDYVPNTPILALTATATDKVRTDIITKLNLKTPKIHEASFERSNVAYEIYEVDNKVKSIIYFCQEHKELTGIIYCNTRKKVKDTAAILSSIEISCAIYHGGMEHEERKIALEEWMSGKKKIMVATNAFGMGIDKPNVRFVLHHDFPETLEAYFQEAGRVGRDGEFSRAISYLEKEDMSHLKDSFNLKFPTAEVVKAIYKSICSYLKIAIGSGKDETYPIDLIAFRKLYKFDLISIYNSLQLLALNGDVTFSESFFKPSNMKFTIGNLELYNFQLQHDKYLPLITLLSRNHSGIFESFKVINEGQICKLLKISKNELVDQLSSMEKQGILEINWQTTLPTITFIRERLPDDYLNLSFEIYGERKENALEKLTKVQQFIESNTCRSIELLRYFGQEISPCRHCDNCLKKNGDEQSESLSNEVLSFINSPKTYLELCAQFPFDIEQLKNTIRLLQHEGKLTFNKGLFSL